MSLKLKLAQLPLDLMNYFIDSLVENLLGTYISTPDFVDNVWEMYGASSTLSDVVNYTDTNWSPSGTYHTTVALYWSPEQNNYLLYTKTTSLVESVLCTEGIRGVYPETIDWDRELSLKVVTHGP